MELVTEGEMERPRRLAHLLSGERSHRFAGRYDHLWGSPRSRGFVQNGSRPIQMIFQEESVHDSLYELDVGALMICVCARRIRIDLNQLGGVLDVLYSIEVEQRSPERCDIASR